jgi:hypothetical protein
MASRLKFSYANMVSTLALFLVLSGGVAYAASKIGTEDIQRQAVTKKKLAPNAVGNNKVKEGSIKPSKLAFPVFYVATPSGGSQDVTNGPDPYPISGGQWTQKANAINVVFSEATATLAYDGSGSGQCQVFFDLRIDGQQVGGGQLQTGSTTPEQVSGQIGAAPGAGPATATPRTLTAQVGSNGDCESGSSIDSTRFQVLDFG